MALVDHRPAGLVEPVPVSASSLGIGPVTDGAIFVKPSSTPEPTGDPSFSGRKSSPATIWRERLGERSRRCAHPESAGRATRPLSARAPQPPKILCRPARAGNVASIALRAAPLRRGKPAMTGRRFGPSSTKSSLQKESPRRAASEIAAHAPTSAFGCGSGSSTS